VEITKTQGFSGFIRKRQGLDKHGSLLKPTREEIVTRKFEIGLPNLTRAPRAASQVSKDSN
jgi:hypothetical protein